MLSTGMCGTRFFLTTASPPPMHPCLELLHKRTVDLQGAYQPYSGEERLESTRSWLLLGYHLKCCGIDSERCLKCVVNEGQRYTLGQTLGS